MEQILAERILIIEDDDVLAEGVKLNLELAGFSAAVAPALKEAQNRIEQEDWALMLLDVNLPDGSGVGFAEKVRKTKDIPIIFLTAKDMDQDIMRGFEAGADDYVTKPFHIQILLQRVRAVLKRYRAGSEKKARVKTGNLEIDFQSWQLRKDGREIALTPTEFRLLRKFCANPGIVLTRDALLEELWDKDGHFVDEHTLTIFISRLRTKIEDENHAYIKTIYGTGYQWIGE